MKRIFKYIALFAVLAALMVSTCSCMALDNVRNSHAVWEDDKEHALTYQNNRYVLVEDGEEAFGSVIFSGVFNKFFPDQFVTEAGVPDLISRYFGLEIDVSKDKKVIRIYNDIIDDEPYIKDASGEKVNRSYYRYYVIESEVDEVIKIYKDVKENNGIFCYMNYSYEDESNSYTAFDAKLNEGLKEALRSEPVSIDDSKEDGISYSIGLYLCNDDKSIIMSLGDIVCYDSSYYVLKYSDTIVKYYPVAEEYTELIESVEYYY